MDYIVTRSKRSRLCVTVCGGKVRVRAPYGLSVQIIEEFLQKHRTWIAHRLKEQAGQRVPDFSDGTTVEILGKVRTVFTGPTELREEALFLPRDERDEALIGLLRKLARERMTQITEEIAKRYGFSYGRISISSAKTRWGSCSVKGTISYTFHVAFLPYDLMYYLAAHELCHTQQMDHSAAFWQLVGTIVPAYAEKRKRLKGYSWAMECL